MSQIRKTRILSQELPEEGRTQTVQQANQKLATNKKACPLADET